MLDPVGHRSKVSGCRRATVQHRENGHRRAKHLLGCFAGWRPFALNAENTLDIGLRYKLLGFRIDDLSWMSLHDTSSP